MGVLKSLFGRHKMPLKPGLDLRIMRNIVRKLIPDFAAVTAQEMGMTDDTFKRQTWDRLDAGDQRVIMGVYRDRTEVV